MANSSTLQIILIIVTVIVIVVTLVIIVRRVFDFVAFAPFGVFFL